MVTKKQRKKLRVKRITRVVEKRGKRDIGRILERDSTVGSHQIAEL